MMNKNMVSEVKSKFYEYEFQLKIYFEDKVYGVYIYKNNALKENKYIEFMTIVTEDFTDDDIALINNIHKKIKFSTKIRGSYIRFKDIGKSDLHMKPYIYFQNGVLKKGYINIDNFTWWALEKSGIAVKSPSIDKLNIKVTYKELLKNIDYNLNCYWRKKVKSKFLFLSDYWVQFSVLNICEILYFIKNKKEMFKIDSVYTIIQDIPYEHRNIIFEAVRIRKSRKRSLYNSRIKRQEDTKKFISFAIESFNNGYFINRKSNVSFL